MRERRIVWFAIVWSTVIYAGIAWYLCRAQATGSFDEALRRPLVLPLYAAALGCFLAGLLGFRSLDPRPRLIVRLALFEAVAVMGLVAAFLTQDWRLFLPAWAVALIGFVREWPRESDAAPQNWK